MIKTSYKKIVPPPLPEDTGHGCFGADSEYSSKIDAMGCGFMLDASKSSKMLLTINPAFFSNDSKSQLNDKSRALSQLEFMLSMIRFVIDFLDINQIAYKMQSEQHALRS